MCISVRHTSSGYLSSGKGAIGQSNAGMSNLWMALECVAERHPAYDKMNSLQFHYYLAHMCLKYSSAWWLSTKIKSMNMMLLWLTHGSAMKPTTERQHTEVWGSWCLHERTTRIQKQGSATYSTMLLSKHSHWKQIRLGTCTSYILDTGNNLIWYITLCMV